VPGAKNGQPLGSPHSPWGEHLPKHRFERAFPSPLADLRVAGYVRIVSNNLGCRSRAAVRVRSDASRRRHPDPTD